MEDKVKAGAAQNLRKSRYANVLYWTVFYTYTFLIASKWFTYEDGILSFDFSMAVLYQHIALLGSIIVGFILLRRHRLALLKKILTVAAVFVILIGAVFIEVRSHIAYLVVLSVLLGQLADCSLLTYIYDMNNAERLYGIFFCHLLVAAVSVFSCFYDRTTSAYWYLMFALSVVAVPCCFLEKKDVEWKISVPETFPKKLYFPLILACVGGISAVAATMMTIGKTTVVLPQARLFYYGGAAVGAVAYFLFYRYCPRPATATLATGFATAVVSIFSYVAAWGDTTAFIGAFFGGATFNICMMNLYYILCNIIKKYKDSGMLKLAPIVSNFAGIVIVTATTMAFFFANEVVIRIGLGVCLLVDILVLATTIYWEKAVSVSAQQEEYVRYDTTLTKEEAYASVGLTEKEIAVANLLLEGLSLREIAEKLFVSENTAKTHRSAVYKKMQVGSREEFLKKMENTI